MDNIIKALKNTNIYIVLNILARVWPYLSKNEQKIVANIITN